MHVPATDSTMDQPKYRVYSRFTATRSDGSVVKLRVQQMPPESLDDVVNIYIDIFTKEEPMHKASGIFKSQEAKAEARMLMHAVMKQIQPHIDICCVDDDPDVVGQLAGASGMYLSDDKTNMSQFRDLVKTKEYKKMFEIAVNALYSYNVTKEQRVDKYYEDLFIVVNPEFRRLGIAYEFVKVRRLVCKLENVAVTSSWMTSWGTQKAGEKDNWHTVVELSYDELSKRFQVVFEDAPPTCKYMVARITE